jgi:glycosyltransferase involved in cell wall biosynthesis
MTVLMVNMTVDLARGGGSAARTVQAARALRDIGIECQIATTTSIGMPPARVDGVEVLSLPAIGGRFRMPVSGFRALGRAIASVDVVLLVNHWTPLNVAAYRAARQTGTPYVVSPVGALPMMGRSRLLKAMYHATYGRRIVANAAAHVAVTAEETRQFASYGVPPERVTVIPNGIPAPTGGDARRFRRLHGLGAAPFLLFLGRLAPIKGADLLVDAFISVSGALSGWHLVLAGPDDGELASLRDAVHRAGMDARVHFTGFLDAEAKGDALAAAELLVVPSRMEAMSIVVLEAASFGRPVLVTDACGVPDVESSGGGWIVPATAEGLAAGIQRALADPSALTRAGEAWRQHATATYSWPSVARLYRNLFERVVVEGPAGNGVERLVRPS